jgi:hypothetical protein
MRQSWEFWEENSKINPRHSESEAIQKLFRKSR